MTMTKLPTDTWTRRLEQAPFWPMLGIGTLTGLGLAWWLLFRLSAGSVSFPVGWVVLVLLCGWLMAARLRAVARRAREQTTNVLDEKPAAPTEMPQETPPGTTPEAGPSTTDTLLDMLPVAGGKFWMGSKKDEADSYPNERPQHPVLQGSFLLASTPVTGGQYREIMKKRIPGQWQLNGDDDLPATHISWEDTVDFCNALSEREGLQAAYDGRRNPVPGSDGYRLPTEAEWEYACRAGTKSQWFWGNEADTGQYAWFNGNSGAKVHPVGLKNPTPGVFTTSAAMSGSGAGIGTMITIRACRSSQPA